MIGRGPGSYSGSGKGAVERVLAMNRMLLDDEGRIGIWNLLTRDGNWEPGALWQNFFRNVTNIPDLEAGKVVFGDFEQDSDLTYASKVLRALEARVSSRLYKSRHVEASALEEGWYRVAARNASVNANASCNAIINVRASERYYDWAAATLAVGSGMGWSTSHSINVLHKHSRGGMLTEARIVTESSDWSYLEVYFIPNGSYPSERELAVEIWDSDRGAVVASNANTAWHALDPFVKDAGTGTVRKSVTLSNTVGLASSDDVVAGGFFRKGSFSLPYPVARVSSTGHETGIADTEISGTNDTGLYRLQYDFYTSETAGDPHTYSLGFNIDSRLYTSDTIDLSGNGWHTDSFLVRKTAVGNMEYKVSEFTSGPSKGKFGLDILVERVA